jgi:hypothetical protein
MMVGTKVRGGDLLMTKGGGVCSPMEIRPLQEAQWILIGKCKCYDLEIVHYHFAEFSQIF